MSPSNRFAFSPTGGQLRLDTAADIAPVLEQLRRVGSEVTSVAFGGYTLGTGACEALAEALGKCERLETVKLGDIFTTRTIEQIPLSIRSLCDAMLALPHLTFLDLSDNAFGVRTVKHLVPFLAKQTTLETLVLSDNGLGPQAGIEIANALKEASEAAGRVGPLRRFECCHSRLESGSIKAFGEVFPAHPRLVQVRMTQNDVRTAGWQPLITGLASCPDLETLDLTDNTATEIGAEAVAASLHKWSRLRKLNLADCMLGPEGGVAVACSLASGSNPVLEHLDLRGNELDETCLEPLVDAVTHHGQRLLHLDVSENEGHEDAMAELTGDWGRLSAALHAHGPRRTLITVEPDAASDIADSEAADVGKDEDDLEETMARLKVA